VTGDGGRTLHVYPAEERLVLTEHTPDTLRTETEEWYVAMGGAPFFTALARSFYQLVRDDELLGPLFPPDWEWNADRLTAHFVKMYGEPRLVEAWNPRLLRIHTGFLITHELRHRWIELFRSAGARIDAPEPLFSQFVGVMLFAAGDLMAASRGAALERGERFDELGRPQ